MCFVFAHLSDKHACFKYCLSKWYVGLVTVSNLNLSALKLLQPTGHVMHQQFNIQQLYVLPTLYLCVSYLSENKQRLMSLTA